MAQEQLHSSAMGFSVPSCAPTNQNSTLLWRSTTPIDFSRRRVPCLRAWKMDMCIHYTVSICIYWYAFIYLCIAPISLGTLGMFMYAWVYTCVHVYADTHLSIIHKQMTSQMSQKSPESQGKTGIDRSYRETDRKILSTRVKRPRYCLPHRGL